MTAATTEQLRALFDRQVAALDAGDLESVLANYRDDAVLIRFDAVARGIDEVRAALGDYLSLRPRTLRMISLQATDDVLFYEADMSLGGGPTRVYGTLVLRDGKIWRQTAVSTGPPPADG